MNEKKEITAEKMQSNKYVFLLSLPIFVEQLLQLLVGNIDQIMISHYSHKSVAAIVNGNQIMTIIIIVLNMMSMAAAVVIPPRLSAGKKIHVDRISTLSVALIALLGFLASCITLFFHTPIFHMMKVEKDVIDEASIYLSIVGGFAIVQGLYLALAAILRSHTLTKEVMFISIIMNVLNIFGNALLINGWLFFPQLGVMGAAISTVFSKTVGLILIYIELRRKTNVKLKFYFIKYNPFPTLKQLLSIGFPAGIESLSYQLSQMVILGFINTLGNTDVVTKGYCSILANFCYIYAVSIAQAALFSYLLGIHFGLGLCGIWIAMAMDECTRGLIYVIVFKRGKWINHYMVTPKAA